MRFSSSQLAAAQPAAPLSPAVIRLMATARGKVAESNRLLLGARRLTPAAAHRLHNRLQGILSQVQAATTQAVQAHTAGFGSAQDNGNNMVSRTLKYGAYGIGGYLLYRALRAPHARPLSFRGFGGFKLDFSSPLLIGAAVVAAGALFLGSGLSDGTSTDAEANVGPSQQQQRGGGASRSSGGSTVQSIVGTAQQIQQTYNTASGLLSGAAALYTAYTSSDTSSDTSTPPPADAPAPDFT